MIYTLKSNGKTSTLEVRGLSREAANHIIEKILGTIPYSIVGRGDRGGSVFQIEVTNVEEPVGRSLVEAIVNMPEILTSVRAAAIELMKEQKKLAAVKLVKENEGLGLKEAKALCDGLEEKYILNN